MLTIRERCDACGGALADVFSMGSMPLANGLLTPEQRKQPSQSFPLMVAECLTCSLVQLRYVVDPKELYRDYRFYTGASDPNAGYFLRLANWIKNLTPGRRILEIGSNDGTLLTALEHRNFDVTGIDPATAQCEQARARLSHGEVICKYWDTSAAHDFKGQFEVVVACNVLGHSNDLGEFITGVRRVLRPNGLFIIEVQHLSALLGQAAFELIYHEHVSYFDESSLGSLLTRYGFNVLGSEVAEAQCGTLRMWASATGDGIDTSPSSHDWSAFRAAVINRRDAVAEHIDTMQREGRRVCFYGAPAKATQLANYWRLGTDTIEFATDTTPAKQGHYIPGALIPVVHPSRLEPNDAAIVAAWNFYPQIVHQESAFLAAGGKLINPTLRGINCEDCRVDDRLRQMA